MTTLYKIYFISVAILYSRAGQDLYLNFYCEDDFLFKTIFIKYFI